MKREYIEINRYCLASKQTDCIKLLNEIMEQPSIPIHGPVHHFIVPAVMLTVFNNIYGNKDQLKEQLKAAADRAKIVPGANCAYYGVCGATLGVGIFASIVTETTPFSIEPWSNVMAITSAIGQEMSKHGGARCCKRDSYIAVLVGAEKIKELLKIELPAIKPTCKHFPKNKECRKDKCLFYPKKAN